MYRRAYVWFFVLVLREGMEIKQSIQCKKSNLFSSLFLLVCLQLYTSMLQSLYQLFLSLVDNIPTNLLSLYTFGLSQ